MRPALIIAIAVLCWGCHLDMHDQAKYKPLSDSEFYADGSAGRSLPEGTVARGHPRTDELLFTGKIGGTFSNIFPFPVTETVLNRGQDRYNTFCSPCHGRTGDGNGMIVERGFPKPRSYHNDTLRAEPAGYYFDVITNGLGRMYSYAASVSVKDRWAIIAYIRALQLSQNVPYTRLSANEQRRVSESGQ